MTNINDGELRKEIIEKTQWPYGRRQVQYQTVDPSLPGIRNMEHRYDIMNFPKSFNGETVLDIGCNIGMICFDAKRRGAKRVVGIDYKQETIEVAKKLAKKFNLDVEFYTFNVDSGLDVLKSIIGEDVFDHVFALSIWGHVNKQYLANIINFYSDKLCWFEGHEAGWTGDTRNKIELDLERLLNFKYYEFIGQTTDRNPRQNYKLSHTYRVILNDRSSEIYFNGDMYKVVRGAYQEKASGDKSYPEDVQYYSYKGKFSNYLANIDDKYGFKIFIQDDVYETQDLNEKRSIAENIYKIQNVLHLEGFAPNAHELITCHDDQTFFYGIKTDNLCGTFIDPPIEWKQSLVDFCNKNNISRSGHSITEELIPNNCIKVDDQIYLIDIDLKWEIK